MDIIHPVQSRSLIRRRQLIGRVYIRISGISVFHQCIDQVCKNRIASVLLGCGIRFHAVGQGVAHRGFAAVDRKQNCFRETNRGQPVIAERIHAGPQIDKLVGCNRVEQGSGSVLDADCIAGNIVSTDTEYTFTVTGETILTAVYEDMPSGGSEITPTPDKKDGLSGGAIAGIVIGSAAVAGIGGFAVFWFAVKKKSFADLVAAIKGIFKKKQ